MIENLEFALIPSLKEAKELYVAVALMKEYGFQIIEENVVESCLRTYVVGINLPTPPAILEKLINLKSQGEIIARSRVYLANENYHPKVYLIRKFDNTLIAFVGSANATKGGLTHNVEMSIKVTDQKECGNLLIWFNDLYSRSQNIDNEFIEEYKTTFNRNQQINTTTRGNISRLFKQNSTPNLSSPQIVKEGQYFTQADFDAFAFDRQLETGTSFVQARGQVRLKLINLHELIFDEFTAHGMMNIFPALRRNNFTSQHFHSRGYNHIRKESIWLNYGKNLSGFTNHLRMQLILMNNSKESYVGIWLFGKENSSFEDRQRLQDGISNPIYLDRFYRALQLLGDSYWIALGDNLSFDLDKLLNKEQLVEFISQDDFSDYFIIGRNYHPNHPDISSENIAETVLIEFSKVYRIYSLMTEKI